MKGSGRTVPSGNGSLLIVQGVLHSLSYKLRLKVLCGTKLITKNEKSRKNLLKEVKRNIDQNIVFLISLFIAGSLNAQIGVGPIEYVKLNSGRFSEEDIFKDYPYKYKIETAENISKMILRK